MTSLKQVTSVTVTSPWSDFDSSGGSIGRGAVVNPSYPIFFFDYYTGQVAVGYVVGSTGYTLQNQADANYFVTPGFYFSVFGYNNWIGGGGICAVSGCMENGTSECGPWWAIADLASSTLNTYCVGMIPNNPVAGHFQDIMADLVNGNILIITMDTTLSNNIVWIAPISQVSSLLSNTAPSSLKWVYIQSSQGSNNYVYRQGATMYSGNVVEASFVGNTLYVWVIPLSTLYSNASTGTPSSSSSPITAGTLYQVASLSSQTTAIPTVIGIPGSSGITVYVSVEVVISDSSAGVYNLSPSNWSVSNSNTFTLPATGNTFTKTAWNGVFIVPAYSGSTLYVVALDPKKMSMDYATTTGAYIIAGAEGYVAVASQEPNSSSVTWTVYQVLLDHTYVFQNVSITVSGTSITATGTLYDETAGSAVSGATVYLVAVSSLSDQYSDDVQFINSGSTNSNGQFSITGTTVSGYSYYGVLYTP